MQADRTCAWQVCVRRKKSREICRIDSPPFDLWIGRTPRSPTEPFQQERAMRFMVLVKATKDSEAGKMPSEALLAEMAKFNEEMVKAGVMLEGNGLQPSSKGARIRFTGDKRMVIDGPFAETKELIAGYWVIQVKSKEEAIAWMKRCPNPYQQPPLPQLLEILQEQLAFGRDVELAIDTQPVVLDSSDRDVQASGDQRRRVSGEDQPDQLPLAGAELRPKPIRQVLVDLSGDRRSLVGATEAGLARLDVERMQGGEHRELGL